MRGRSDVRYREVASPPALELTASGRVVEARTPSRRSARSTHSSAASVSTAHGLAYLVVGSGYEGLEVGDVLREFGYRTQRWSDVDSVQGGLHHEVPDIAVVDARGDALKVRGVINALQGCGLRPDQLYLVLPERASDTAFRRLRSQGVAGVIPERFVLTGLRRLLADRAQRERPAPKTEQPARRSWTAPSGLGPGLCVGDRFVLEEQLGEGSWSVVYAAQDTELDERVAIKFFRPSSTARDAAMRFRREARVCRRMSHRNLVRVFEFGTWQGLLFLTMECLDGHTLAEILKHGGGLMGVRTATRVMYDAASALEEAHRHGVAHRDIKPSNLFVERSGHARVLDFGFAQSDQSDLIRSDIRRVVGTPAYVAPERVLGRSTNDLRGDFFSFGVVFYELLTGMRPFHRRGVKDTLDALIGEDPVPVRRVRPEVPPQLEALLQQLLDKQPANRPPDWHVVRKALARIHRQLGSNATAVTMPGSFAGIADGRH